MLTSRLRTDASNGRLFCDGPLNGPLRSGNLSTLDDPNQKCDDGQDQQDMDEPAASHQITIGDLKMDICVIAHTFVLLFAPLLHCGPLRGAGRYWAYRPELHVLEVPLRNRDPVNRSALGMAALLRMSDLVRADNEAIRRGSNIVKKESQ